MKAITTRYIGATNRKAARILATDLDGNRVTLPAEGDFPYDDIHRAAAVALCAKMHWPGAETLVGGSVKHGKVWVFDPARALLTRALPLLVQLGDHIGNGPVDPERAGSLGSRCDLIGDIREQLQGEGAS